MKLFHKLGLTFYGLYLEEKLIGTIMVNFDSKNNSIGIYCVATSEEYRKHGYQTKALRAILSEAKNNGVKYAIAQCLETSVKMFLNLPKVKPEKTKTGNFVLFKLKE